jgi:predicted DNA-binding transcriptional regulator YafY
MGSKKPTPAPATLTTQRAARLYKLLTLLGDGPLTRRILLARLKIDVRSFYRDLAALRSLRIEIALRDDNRYVLPVNLDDALARLPFPDPGLSVRDALQLCNGSTAAHRKLKHSVNAFLQVGTGRAR